MRQAVSLLEVKTARRGLVEITREVEAWTTAQLMETGLLTVFCQHTSASLLIQENAAAEVRSDLEAYFEAIAPEEPDRYLHDDEGPDDMPAHIRSALTGVGLSIPLIAGRLALGTWQASTFLSIADARTHVQWRYIFWAIEAQETDNASPRLTEGLSARIGTP